MVFFDPGSVESLDSEPSRDIVHGRSMRQLAPFNPQPGSRELKTDAYLAGLSSVYPAWDSSLWNSTAHKYGGSSHLS